MWELEYSKEVISYFIDNYPYTFPLLVKIEELKFLPDANPEEEYTQLEPNFYRMRSKAKGYIFGLLSPLNSNCPRNHLPGS